ncbi:tetratricopeptide repeat protein [Micromonospora coerulea]|uniref:tetratricopeptide repeat protein n=1 Tax=Micromonospora coerulea TaxID=47856 RepID=UPI001908C08A|nr:tetratricopeptide repeat protein [Micromonospora veneta]
MMRHAASDAGVARASALLEVGRIEAARREIAAVLAGDPDNVEALYVLAGSYQAEDEFAAMQDVAVRAVAVAPGQHEGHLLLAFAQIGVEDPTAARASALETVRLAPEDWRGYAALALASLNLGQPRRAFRTIKRAVGMAPESAGPHYIRALMFHSIGWNLFANRSYRRALALDPEHKAALTGLGRVAATRGWLAAAAGHISAVLAAEPTNDAARTELDRVVIGGLCGWAIMSVWTAGFMGMFAVLPWMWLPALLPPALWLLWAARTWRALSPGARAYAENVVRTDIRARVRLFGLALCALTAAGLIIIALRQDPDQPPSAAMVVPMVAHFLALIVSAAAIVTADRKVAGARR